MKYAILELIYKFDKGRKFIHIRRRFLNRLNAFIPGRIVQTDLRGLWHRLEGPNKWLPTCCTPHYIELTTNTPVYDTYLKQNGVRCGYPVINNAEKLHTLHKSLMYNVGKNKRHYIMCICRYDQYYVIDGSHRSAILCAQGAHYNKIKVVSHFWLFVFSLLNMQLIRVR